MAGCHVRSEDGSEGEDTMSEPGDQVLVGPDNAAWCRAAFLYVTAGNCKPFVLQKTLHHLSDHYVLTRAQLLAMTSLLRMTTNTRIRAGTVPRKENVRTESF